MSPRAESRLKQNLMLMILALLGLGMAGWVHADGRQLDGPIEVLEPWIGVWQIEAEWSNGTPLWAQSEYQPILGGAFLEAAVLVREGEHELYQRYRTIFTWDSESQGFAAHGFSHGGSYGVSGFEIKGSEVGMVYASEWKDGEVEIKETVELISLTEMTWKVWALSPGMSDWSQIMDGIWRRVDAEPIALPPAESLSGELARLDAFLGGWETSSIRPGRKMWVREEIETALAGHFLQTTSWVIEGDGDMEQRSTSMIGAAEHGLRVVSFMSDGSLMDVSASIEGEPGHQRIISELPPRPRPDGKPGRLVRQVMQIESIDTFSWITLVKPRQLESTESGSSDADQIDEWTEVDRGLWHRQGEPASMSVGAIRPERFVARGAELRSFTRQATIPASPEQVFAVWSTPEGWSSVYGPPSSARIELAIGGRYEWLFGGLVGSNGCQVLSYIPNRMISFTWNAPPSQPEARVHRTWVVVQLEPAGSRDQPATEVRLTHLGFAEGAIWDADMAYFENAWGRVLEGMKAKLGSS